MSTKDREFLVRMGICASRFVDIIDKNRQAVSRGIKSKKAYFRPRDLAIALAYWKEHNPELRILAEKIIPELYFDSAAMIIAVSESSVAHRPKKLDTDLTSEYQFFSDDLIAFKNDLPSCASELERIIPNEQNEITLYIRSQDVSYAARDRLPVFDEAIRLRNALYRAKSNNSAILVTA